MGLINFDSVDLPKTNDVNVVKTNNSIRFISETSLALLSDAIGEFNENESIHFDTHCGWTPHELLHYILSKTGVANVYIATWAIKDYPAQTIVNAVLNGCIQELHLRLDYRIKTTSPSAYYLLKQNCASLNEAYCHAKITVVQNDIWSISVVGSANFSKNPRGEAGVITVNKLVADNRIKFILNTENGLDKGTIE